MIFNLLGMLDLIVAVAPCIMTNLGSAQGLLHDTDLRNDTYFPLALVPTFPVPLAFVLHAVSLWQLLHGSAR